MKLRYLRNNKGFTMFELFIVIIIIGILVAIAVPKFMQITTKAEDSVLKYNSSLIVKVLALNIYKYEGEDRYNPRKSGTAFDYSENSLNNFLEKHLEDYQAGGNKDNIVNPRSRSKAILNWTAPLSGSIDDGRDPAVFITGNSAYSYTGGGSTENIVGSIVAYFNASEPYNAQVYFIDRDGNKSEKIADFN